MGKMTEMFDRQKTKDDEPADRTYIKGLLWIVGLMIIAAAAFYTQDDIPAYWRDVVDIVMGWSQP